jgi:DNA-binding XRE family transcriptional regulator
MGLQMSSLANQLNPWGAQSGQDDPGQPRTARLANDRHWLQQRRHKEAEWNAEPRDDNPCAQASHDRSWADSCFAGYRIFGDQLYELRRCHRCLWLASRPVRFIDALAYLFEQLQSLQRPRAIIVRSTSLLMSWAVSHIPPQLGIVSLHDPRAPAADLALSAGRTDWRQFGLDLRQRREAADLTREQLCTLAGISHATVRNVETGRHRPTARILRRLVAVPPLRLSEARDLAGKDSPP